MPRAAVLLILVGSFSFPSDLAGQNKKLTPSDLPEFLARYGNSLNPLDEAYTELANEKLPLRDESGQPLGRRPIEDRRKALADLRQTLHRLTTSPQDLVLTTTLFVQTETLADDLFDLSQICYDNNREEFGKRLYDLMAAVDQNKESLESYALSLAEEKQQRILQLERENQALQQKLKGAPRKAKSKSSPRR